MRNETTVDVSASREAVWKVLVDVEVLPELTASMSSVQKLDPGPLRVGMRVRIRQPKLPTTVWTVTEVAENERFAWVAKGPGLRTTGVHEVLTVDGTTRLHLAIEQAGPLAGLVGRLIGNLTDRYIALEAAGIKRRAEESG